MAIARIAPSTAAPPDMSCFISSIEAAGLMEIPPVSNVIPLPTRAMVGRRLEGRRGPYSRTISRGGCALPRPTARIAPIFSFLSSASASTLTRRSVSSASLRACSAIQAGVCTLPGSLDSSRAKFVDVATISPIRAPLRIGALWRSSAGISSQLSRTGGDSSSVLYLSKRYAPRMSPSASACPTASAPMRRSEGTSTAARFAFARPRARSARPPARRRPSGSSSRSEPKPTKIRRPPATPSVGRLCTSPSLPVRSPDFR